MWRRCARLLIGLIALGTSGVSILWLGINYSHILRKQLRPASNRQPAPVIDPALAKDPSIDGAKIKVIGPLANAVNSDGEIDGISGSPADADTQMTAPENTPQNAAVVRPFDLVSHSARYGQAQHFRATFPITDYRYFRLVVPAHSQSPKLHGTFASFSDNERRASLAADFLVLDNYQLEGFLHGTSMDAVFSRESSSGAVDLMLSPTISNSKEYYLVFSSPDERSRFITADLTLTFE